MLSSLVNILRHDSWSLIVSIRHGPHRRRSWDARYKRGLTAVAIVNIVAVYMLACLRNTRRQHARPWTQFGWDHFATNHWSLRRRWTSRALAGTNVNIYKRRWSDVRGRDGRDPWHPPTSHSNPFKYDVVTKIVLFQIKSSIFVRISIKNDSRH